MAKGKVPIESETESAVASDKSRRGREVRMRHQFITWIRDGSKTIADLKIKHYLQLGWQAK